MQPARQPRADSHTGAAGAAAGPTGRSAGQRLGLQGRAATRLATAGLALVLVSLTGFALWASLSTSRATRHVLYVAGLYGALEQARFALVSEESLERSYRLDPDPQTRAELDRAARSLREALTFVDLHGDSNARKHIALARAQHDHYQDGVRQELAAIDAGQPERAEALDRAGEPLFATMARELDQAATSEGAEALGALTDLDRRAGTVAVATPIAFTVGWCCWRCSG